MTHTKTHININRAIKSEKIVDEQKLSGKLAAKMETRFPAILLEMKSTLLRWCRRQMCVCVCVCLRGDLN